MEEIFGQFDGFIYKERKPLNSLVCGIGYNDSPFVVQPICDGKKTWHPAYYTWQNMLNRCYNSKFKDRRPYRDWETDRKSTRLNSSHSAKSRMPSSA